MKSYRHNLPRSAILSPIRIGIIAGIIALVTLLLSAAAHAQRGGTAESVDRRLNELQRSVANLNAQLEQLRAQDRRLQQQLEDMQTRVGQRLERLEKGTSAKPVPRSAGPKRQAKPKPKAPRN